VPLVNLALKGGYAAHSGLGGAGIVPEARLLRFFGELSYFFVFDG
jgi:hypothetical protein